MEHHRFVQFGAVTTFPAPYLCEAAELHGFFFRANHDRLDEHLIAADIVLTSTARSGATYC